VQRPAEHVGAACEKRACKHRQAYQPKASRHEATSDRGDGIFQQRGIRFAAGKCSICAYSGDRSASILTEYANRHCDRAISQ
jgi:hypothetical protein